MGSFDLSDRSRRLLATLVREYVETGGPVASQLLARRSGLGVSSATVRTVLAQLEDAGYVHQPHTSAGRVPTDRGYRVFVDLLLESRKPTRASVVVEHRLREQAERSPLVDDLLASASHLVSRAVRYVGFALGDSPSAVLQRLEFVPLGGSRVLVVVVSCGNQVGQKVVDVEEEVSPDELVRAANYLNTEFGGLPLAEVRAAVLARLQQERTLYDRLLARALRLAHSTLEEMPNPHTFHVEGAASLLDRPAQGGASLATLRALLEMLEQKERMVHLLNQYIDGPGLTVVIGAEHAMPGLRPFSLVASTASDATGIRTVGVIGPTRMHYSRTIAFVDGTTQAVSRVLRAAS
ncbi:MAG: heat-inducible transcription repressor HrcA [Acidobacteria bacterium RIFCSPLOWO2_02_FULL_68_18]|nr:MAG: heat-inducible transcription repressor HrcA [Acidobacteria bacterium RIFCSPLOWO2_02_FULL_68_18]OFW50008.1 MAG: heat-inducible transcription repressor HrcA [Acidobacteria bacterium RIFCSPLOWO2_12_FULL_68_19]